MRALANTGKERDCEIHHTSERVEFHSPLGKFMSRVIKTPLDAPKFKLTYVKGFRQNFYIIKSHEGTASPLFYFILEYVMGISLYPRQGDFKEFNKKEKEKEKEKGG